MKNNKLQVKNLQVSFRTQAGILKAVRNISFDLKEGETLAIVGESGSGKSVTSKAIIGILAGNSIVEGGEILYDGQDLLKIDEEHFHKIRGDKIAMIFQDPLSSLNPIMRVGKQLTEAMILNGKARQKNSRKEFNTHLKLLKENLNECNGNNEENARLCMTFDKFCINSTHLEKKYNDSYASLVTLNTNLEETTFLIEKNQKVAVKKSARNFAKLLREANHPYVIKDEEFNAHLSELVNFINNKEALANKEETLKVFNNLHTLTLEAKERKHPNFFRLGYYKFAHPEFDEFSIASIEALDELTLNGLNEEFMNNFIALGTTGMQHSRDVSIAKKKAIIDRIKKYRGDIEAMEILDKKQIESELKPIVKAVNDAIDFLRVKKHSVEYSFGISLKHEVKRYFTGIKINPKNQNKYNKSMAKYNKLVEAGRTPSWKVIPPYLIDLDLTKTNILKIVDDIIARYERDIANTTYNAKEEMVELVDFFKEQASRLVYRVTKGIAKTKALELLKEVGIPEPAIRYKQYPFEFSGGMRQRIVIAIALSANPDILICDEPTTALDVTIQSQILELINKIKEERHLSIIFITHDLGVVANMADRIAVMYAGKIVEYGTSEDIFYDPRHPYTWALLASMPDLDTKEKLEAIPGTPPNMIYPPVGDAFADRNKYALQIDYEMEPPLFEISETHYAATWLLHPNAPKVEPPKIIKERIARMKKEAEEL